MLELADSVGVGSLCLLIFELNRDFVIRSARERSATKKRCRYRRVAAIFPICCVSRPNQGWVRSRLKQVYCGCWVGCFYCFNQWSSTGTLQKESFCRLDRNSPIWLHNLRTFSGPFSHNQILMRLILALPIYDLNLLWMRVFQLVA